MSDKKNKEPRIVFWSILILGLGYMYKNVFKK
jgi:hypothetical protein